MTYYAFILSILFFLPFTKLKYILLFILYQMGEMWQFWWHYYTNDTQYNAHYSKAGLLMLGDVQPLYFSSQQKLTWTNTPITFRLYHNRGLLLLWGVSFYFSGSFIFHLIAFSWARRRVGLTVCGRNATSALTIKGGEEKDVLVAF